jgi:hypothetical protein
MGTDNPLMEREQKNRKKLNLRRRKRSIFHWVDHLRKRRKCSLSMVSKTD